MPTLPFDQGCLAHPRQRVIAVAERRAQNVVVPLGEKVAALVHLDEDVAALDRLELVASCRAARRCERPRN